MLEWVAYHKAIGFERIVVFSNDCTDLTDELLEAMAAHGFLEHYTQVVPSGESPQGHAVASLREMELLANGDWAIFLDADEFLNVQIEGGTVDDLTEFVRKKNCIGMVINWRVFGDSYNDSFQGRLISHDYTRCDAGLDVTQFKTYFQKNDETAGVSRFLHLCDLNPGKSALNRFLAPDATVFSKERWARSRREGRWLDRWIEEGTSPFGSTYGDFAEYPVAQINHYMVRDAYSFQLKGERGIGTRPSTARQRYTDDFFARWNRNEGDDVSILRWEAATMEHIAQITQTCGLKALVAKITSEYRAGYQVTKDHDRDKFPLTLPSRERHFIKQTYSTSRGVIEYGSGGSTVLAARIGLPIISVESSNTWAAELRSTIEEMPSCHDTTIIAHVDIGATHKWGYPINNNKYAQYWKYPLHPWLQDVDFVPDTVLIDGRMRMGCFVATLAMTKRDVRILFDDYVDRKRYHRVEQFLKPSKTVGRMAIFDARPGLLSMADFAAFVPMLFEMK